MDPQIIASTVKSTASKATASMDGQIFFLVPSPLLRQLVNNSMIQFRFSRTFCFFLLALRERMDPQGMSTVLKGAASRATTSMHALRDRMRIDPLEIFMSLLTGICCCSSCERCLDRLCCCCNNRSRDD
ncbi:unnamed protein product [Urochloa decumbens]|uniref:Uncharacterized protein n=1 Tax=Urochloa decumbens TaxID=240449 RepID=A0ABC9DN02_9POAL